MTEGQTEAPAQDGPQQVPTFTTGFDFLNHHLNAAMRYIERATPKDEAHIGPNTAFKLAKAHTELATVGAFAAIAQNLQGLTATHGVAIADFAESVDRIAAQMEEDRKARMGVGEPWDAAEDYASALEGLEPSEVVQEPQDGPREALPPITRFQRQQAARAAETPPDSKER